MIHRWHYTHSKIPPESPWYLRLSYGIFGLVNLGKGQRVQKKRERKDKSSLKLLKLNLKFSSNLLLVCLWMIYWNFTPSANSLFCEGN